ncbi:hypothetical protein HBH53_137210 [Parastagonospora nodorum]|nr:hypothetical protein HBH53_137210 [Parastagonospora nodorum]KAH4003509.1 hypothetical protein HBI10_060750 [Parastagonospora nodorum]KAH4028887.1 hypothetical protein HBI13_041640 [Parastagonospora nodorum]KAH4128882.1 hypothetical protein HBH47_034100 [Parastagonospora nodorum]KAH5044396.1 hypothetical protein HBI75_025130 [Parastagonospora nodorum]
MLIPLSYIHEEKRKATISEDAAPAAKRAHPMQRGIVITNEIKSKKKTPSLCNMMSQIISRRVRNRGRICPIPRSVQ